MWGSFNSLTTRRILVGSGCYETSDGGLTDFGHDLVAELNTSRVAIDVSHVGNRTTAEALLKSSAPIVASHVLPYELKAHRRNKPISLLREIVDKGGLVGVTMFPAFLPRGASSTIDDYVDAIEWTIDQCGEEGVGYGTDLTQGQGRAFFDWITRSMGTGRRITSLGRVTPLDGFERIESSPNLARAMERRRWPARRRERVLGANWLRFLGDVWGDDQTQVKSRT